MLTLWDFQNDVIDRSDEAERAGARGICWRMATGTGKTVTATEKIRRIHKAGKKTLIVTHRQLLGDQFLDKAVTAGLAFDVSLIRPRHREMAWQSIWIANAPTLWRRLKTTRIEPDYIIVDEAHHLAAKTFQDILERWKRAILIGLTATPKRLDGEPLDPLEVLIDGPSVKYHIQHQHLSPYEGFNLDVGLHDDAAPLVAGDYNMGDQEQRLSADSGRIMAKVRDKANEYLPGRRWIAFGPTIAASRKLAEDLREDGFKCEHVDGTMSSGEILNVMRRFKDGMLDGICSVNLIDEGVDCPWADAILIYRDTASEVRYLQMVGRVLRYFKDKVALIIDCVGVVKRHGLPCAERTWDLRGKTDNSAVGGVKICPGCFRYIPVGSPCECGYAPEMKAAGEAAGGKEEVDIELVRMDVPDYGELVIRRDESDHDGFVRDDINRALYESWVSGGPDGIKALAQKLGKDVGWSQWWIDYIGARVGSSHQHA